MKKLVYWFVLLCQYFPLQSVRNWSATWLALHDPVLMDRIKKSRGK